MSEAILRAGVEALSYAPEFHLTRRGKTIVDPFGQHRRCCSERRNRCYVHLIQYHQNIDIDVLMIQCEPWCRGRKTFTASIEMRAQICGEFWSLRNRFI